MILNRQPLLILVLAFILGIFFQDEFLLSESFMFSILLISILLCLTFFVEHYILFKLRPVFLFIIFFGLGISLHYFNSKSFDNIELSKNETVIFKVLKKLNSNEKYKKYEVLAEANKQSFYAIVNINKSKEELNFLNYYKAKAYIVKPVSPDYDFQFNYAKYLQRKNISHIIYINDDLLISSRNDISFSEKIKQKRLNVLSKISQTEMSIRSREFLKGIILADRTEIDAETANDFNRSGLMHFLAISGTHIVVIFGMLYLLLMKFSTVKFKRYAIIVSLLFIWVFALFIGFGNSVVRSCIMISVYFIYVLLQRKPDLLHSLSISAFVILMMDTQQIFDVGFQLSFIAVLGIFWLNQPILKYFPRQDNYFKKLIYNTISISISAQLATLPLVIYYFHQFSFISLLANFFIVPFSETIIIFSFVMTFLIGFGLDFKMINLIYDFIIDILLKSIHWFAGFNSVYFENIPLNLVEVLALFCVLYFFKFFLKKPVLKSITNLIVAVMLFLIIRMGYNAYEFNRNEILVHQFKNEKVFSLKKGNHVAFYISSKKHENQIKKFVISPYLSSRRIKDFEVKIIPPHVKSVVFEDEIINIK